MEAKIHKPVLIVIAGPNGSGRTTITSRVLHHEWLEDSIYINPDNIAQRMTEGKIFKEYVKEIPEWAIGIANKEG